MTTWIIFYLSCTLVFNAYLATEDDTGFRRIWTMLLLCTLPPIIFLLSGVLEVWRFIDRHTQATTFFFFLFHRKSLKIDLETLERLDSMVYQQHQGRHIRDRLRRTAIRCIFKVNHYTPNPENGSAS